MTLGSPDAAVLYGSRPALDDSMHGGTAASRGRPRRVDRTEHETAPSRTSARRARVARRYPSDGRPRRVGRMRRGFYTDASPELVREMSAVVMEFSELWRPCILAGVKAVVGMPG